MKIKLFILFLFSCVSCKDPHNNSIAYPKEIIARNMIKQFDAAIWCAYTFNIRCYSLDKLGVSCNSELPEKYLFLFHEKKMLSIVFYQKNTCFIFDKGINNKMYDNHFNESIFGEINPIHKVYVSNKDTLVDSVATYSGRTYAPLSNCISKNERLHSLVNMNDSCKISLLRHNVNYLPYRLILILNNKLENTRND